MPIESVCLSLGLFRCIFRQRTEQRLLPGGDLQEPFKVTFERLVWWILRLRNAGSERLLFLQTLQGRLNARVTAKIRQEPGLSY